MENTSGSQYLVLVNGIDYRSDDPLVALCDLDSDRVRVVIYDDAPFPKFYDVPNPILNQDCTFDVYAIQVRSPMRKVFTGILISKTLTLEPKPRVEYVAMTRDTIQKHEHRIQGV
jgi:hypothetical protein